MNGGVVLGDVGAERGPPSEPDANAVECAVGAALAEEGSRGDLASRDSPSRTMTCQAWDLRSELCGNRLGDSLQWCGDG